MQLKWSVMLCVGMLGVVALNAQADNQVYQGKWLGKNAGASLQLDKSGAQFTVNGQTFKDSTPEFFISNISKSYFHVCVLQQTTLRILLRHAVE